MPGNVIGIVNHKIRIRDVNWCKQRFFRRNPKIRDCWMEMTVEFTVLGTGSVLVPRFVFLLMN